MGGATFLRADLHVHTVPDDPAAARRPVDEFVRRAAERGLKVLGITNHNAVLNIEEAIESGEREGVLVLPGIEITTHEGHLLGLFDPRALDELRDLASKSTLRLQPDPRDGSLRSTRSLLDLMHEISTRGGLAIPAHVDATDGAARIMNAKSLASMLGSPDLAGLEFARTDALRTFFTNDDTDDARREAWLARQQVAELRERGLARIMSSDAHSPDQVGKDRESRTLTRLRLDQPDFAAVRNALVNAPRARCKAESLLPPSYPRLLRATFEGGFLDGVKIEFGPNLNCFIGGRGSGKSTALLAIRVALGGTLEDEEGDPDDPDRMPDRTIVELLDEVGSTRTAIRDRGCEAIDKTGAPIGLRIEGLAQGAAGHLLRTYHQDPRVLVRFLDQFVDTDTHELREADLIRQLKDNEATVTGTNEGLDRQPALEKEVRALEAQLGAAQRSQLEKIAEWAGRLASEGPFLSAIETQIKRLLDPGDDPLPIDLTEMAEQFGVDLSRTDLSPYVEGPKALPALIVSLTNARHEAKTDWASRMDEASRDSRVVLGGWQKHHTELSSRLELKRRELEKQGLKVEAGALLKLATQLEQARRSLSTIKTRREQYLLALKTRSDLVESLRANRDSLFNRRRISLRGLTKVANAASRGANIHVKCERAALRNPWKDWLTRSFIMRSPRADRVAEAVLPHEVADALLNGADHLKAFLTSTKERCFSDAEILEHTKRLRTWPNLFELQTMRLEDRVRLLLEEPGRKGAREFDHLSEGQQRSMILSLMLCADSRAPLVLDQPEDHLDAPYVATALVGHLESAKEQRQVIVATHSANLTVLGDAELVLPMYAAGGHGAPRDEGAVDNPATRTRVVELLEGGFDAFRRRASRYGMHIK